MTQWHSLLKTLGFTESEAKIYLLSLELGPSPVQNLAKKASVSRVTAYAVIESLKTKGLMTSVEKGKKTLYAAESPDRLVSVVHAKLQQMEITLREIESTIDDLKLLQRGERPFVKLFEGPEGLKAVHEDILATKPESIHTITNSDALYRLYSPEYFETVRQELDRRKTPVQGIVIKASGLHTSQPYAHNRQLPADLFPFYGDITMYGNKVIFTSLRGKNVTVLVENDVIAETLKVLFHLAFEGADRYDILREKKKTGDS